MISLRIRHLAALFSLALIAPATFAEDEMDTPAKEIAAYGQPDKVICGLNVTKTSLKEIKAKLGAPSYKSHDEMDHDIYRWKKNGLKIEMVLDGTSINQLIINGVDNAGLCKSGRGLQLGQTFDEVKAIYHRIDVFASDDRKDITGGLLSWQNTSDLSISLQFSKKDRRLTEILYTYMLE